MADALTRCDPGEGRGDAGTTRAQAAGAVCPIRRWGETEDVGKAVAGLVSGDIPFSTGGAFYVDVGLHIPRF